MSSSSPSEPAIINDKGPCTRSRTAAVPAQGQKSRPSRSTGPVTPPRVAASAVPQHIAKMPGTPFVHKSSATAPYTSNALFSPPKFRRMALEMRSKFIAPMRPQAFLDQFLPVAKSTKKPWKWNAELKGILQEVAGKTKEVHMYQPLIEALQVACDGNLVLVNTSAVPDPGAGILVPEGLKPDITWYGPDYDSATGKVTDFSLMEVHMELNKNENDDGLLDDGTLSFENSTIVTYATAQLGLQFRTHIFSVLLCGAYARFIRWDRTGAIVSARFDYTASDALLQFFWRYGKLSPEARGKDLSISRPTPKEELEARAGLKTDPDAPSALLKFSVFDEASKELRFFVGNEQGLKGNSSATGRATRTFKVWDLHGQRPVLLKDTWRVLLPGMQKEGDIYAILHDKSVPYISEVVCSGDAFPVESAGTDNHRTCTHLFATSRWIKRMPEWEKFEGLKPHSHYRIVLEAIGDDLTSFKSSKELVTATQDALEALFVAYRDAHIMHCDISSRNIMIRNGRGLLIDWDLAKAFELDETTGEPIVGDHGTWQFIAYRLVSTPDTLSHTLMDDMESLVHVLNWVALRSMRHSIPHDQLAALLHNVFDAHHKAGAGWVADFSKETFLTGRGITTVGLENSVFVQLLADLAQVFAVQYEAPPLEACAQLDELNKRGGLANANYMDVLKVAKAVEYREREKQRKNPEWMLARMTAALEDASWPSDDAGDPNEVPTSTMMKIMS
ncbi:hypothetical protein Hypma_013875 [Hypsizygus marmoreus]|uniref:Fungal-type protein kinase domain-containing protein n=1 Tax=Hypsizygus marmoreus TaxID=39966 RepID=A0A369KDG2_HYPMA|nr:hypothetical protein Hypma_013875 [Hypsizygus marmoreus]